MWDACQVDMVLSTRPLHCCACQNLDGTGQVTPLWEAHGSCTALGANRVSPRTRVLYSDALLGQDPVRAKLEPRAKAITHPHKHTGPGRASDAPGPVPAALRSLPARGPSSWGQTWPGLGGTGTPCTH